MQGPDVPAQFAAASPGVTQKYYDGLDRLVEVQQPSDPQADRYSFPWLTRYIYDLNLGSAGPDNVTVDGSTVKAYGGLYQTQECLPASTTVALGPGNGQLSGCTFKELRGNGFDGIDRSTKKFEDAFGSPGGPAEATQNYDADPTTYGLLSKSTNANNQYTQFAYDNAGRVQQKSFDNPSITPTEGYTFDADGRTAMITSSLYGKEKYFYDGDGHLIEKDDPTGGGYTSPGVITYGYYPDGKRSSLSLTITPMPKYNGVAFNGSNVIQYAYQTDGLMDHEFVNVGSGGDYKWSYTAAGREQTQRDPSSGSTINVYSSKCQPPNCQVQSTIKLQSKTYTYDQYGRVASLTFPAGRTMAGFLYDAEGDTLQDFAPGNPLLPPAPQYLYSMRGELVWSPQPSVPFQPQWQQPGIYHSTANGALCINDCTVDSRTGQSVSQSATYQYSQPTYPSYTYDQSGRNTQTGLVCWTSGPNGPTIQDSGTLSKAYDAENHTISSSIAGEDGGVVNNGVGNPGQCVVQSSPSTLSWGNSGHPYTASYPGNGQDAPQQNSYHWDGDQVLYMATGTSSPYGVTLFIGTAGQVHLSAPLQNPPPMQDFTTNDRDYAGQQYQSHNSTVYTSFNYPGIRMEVFDKYGPIQVDPPSWGGNTPLNLSYPASISAHKDGYQIAGVTVQGVRAYDPTASQWTTPDAYAGDVHDPTSQKPFMWNNNNPLQYADPTGYDALLEFVPGGADGFGHFQIITYDNKTLSGKVNSVKSSSGHPFGSPVRVDHPSVGDVRKLPTSHGELYYHITTTTTQNSTISTSYDSHKGQTYNLLTNNCETSGQQALNSAGTGVQVYNTGIPNFDPATLEAQGMRAINPSDIRPDNSQNSSSEATQQNAQIGPN